jgi:hypothetical protein
MLSENTPLAKLLGVALWLHTDENGERAFPAQPTLAVMTDADARSLRRSTRQLEAAGFLNAEPGSGKRSERTLESAQSGLWSPPINAMINADNQYSRVPVGGPQNRITDGDAKATVTVLADHIREIDPNCATLLPGLFSPKGLVELADLFGRHGWDGTLGLARRGVARRRPIKNWRCLEETSRKEKVDDLAEA